MVLTPLANATQLEDHTHESEMSQMTATQPVETGFNRIMYIYILDEFTNFYELKRALAWPKRAIREYMIRSGDSGRDPNVRVSMRSGRSLSFPPPLPSTVVARLQVGADGSITRLQVETGRRLCVVSTDTTIPGDDSESSPNQNRTRKPRKRAAHEHPVRVDIPGDDFKSSPRQRQQQQRAERHAGMDARRRWMRDEEETDVRMDASRPTTTCRPRRPTTTTPPPPPPPPPSSPSHPLLTPWLMHVG
ncbi:hypothetical protein BDZ89DRAFT_1036788 [Hymenopellis radicata]|nr:hypothetical protein BDZ89DRAFT_1036788 [Hymenopellis radicata]